MRSAWVIALVCLALAGCGRSDRSEPSAAVEPDAWIAQELGADADIRDIFFLDDRHGWLVGGSHDIRGGFLGITEDGGRSWRFRSGIARPSARAQLFHLNAVHFIDEQTGIIVGDGGFILRSEDGGEHWHELRRGPRVSAHLHDLQFVDRHYGWAVGGQTLLRTVDGGATWSPAIKNDDGSGFSARAICFLDWREGWAMSRHGRILHTTDGGESWTGRWAPEGSQNPVMSSLVFVDRKHGWAVGERGMILHSADGGHSWRRQRGGEKTYLTDVQFADARQGWIVGHRRKNGLSVVLHTDDGGATWAEQAQVAGEELQTLFFTRSGTGWTAGDRIRPLPQKLVRYEPGT